MCFLFASVGFSLFIRVPGSDGGETRRHVRQAAGARQTPDHDGESREALGREYHDQTLLAGPTRPRVRQIGGVSLAQEASGLG
jgi:hypothetical protein